MPSDLTKIDRDAAIAMAVYTGNQLYDEGDERHFWALTLIVSNLFELVGQGETSLERFVSGFRMIAMLSNVDQTVQGWDFVSVARAIRNWIDHGLILDRSQEMNSTNRTRATVERIGFIPALEEGQSDDIYRVYYCGDTRYELLFSPMKFWSYVREWVDSKEQ